MSTQTMTTPPHGVKRRGDDSIESEQRLSKRFDLLNLEHNGKLWVPVNAVAPNASTHPTASSSPPSGEPIAPSHNSYYPRHDTANASYPSLRTKYTPDNSMHLDDTPHTIYIHNLDEELASIPDPSSSSSSNERLIFLPDIERRLGKIPRHVLHGTEAPPPVMGNEMVLYNVPKSLSVPVGSDGVRRAVIEARRRLRGEQGRENRRQEGFETEDGEGMEEVMDTGAERRRQVEGGGTWQTKDENGAMGEDPDAMDLG